MGVPACVFVSVVYVRTGVHVSVSCNRVFRSIVAFPL